MRSAAVSCVVSSGLCSSITHSMKQNVGRADSKRSRAGNRSLTAQRSQLSGLISWTNTHASSLIFLIRMNTN